MLQKLENLYLGILRFVVILVAGLLLAAVVIFGTASLRALQSAPENAKATPVVRDDALKKSVLEKAATPETSESLQPPTKKTDPNQPYYDRAAKAIVEFVSVNSKGQESVDAQQVANITKNRAANYDKQGLTGTFAKNFAESVERLLRDPDVVAFAKQSSPLQIVNRLLNVFVEQFDSQIEQTNAANIARQQEHLERKAEGQQSIYFAGAAFGSFLMIVFLSIIIRIERNLRHLERPTV